LINPDFFIMENVRGMMSFERKSEEDIQQETNSQYTFIPVLVDAQNFDIPQSRRRYIIIGAKNFIFLRQIEEIFKSKSKVKSKYNLSDALYGLPKIGTNPFKLNPNYESEENGYIIRKIGTVQNEFRKRINGNREVKYVLNHKSRFNNSNDLDIYKLLPEGENSLHPSIKGLSKYNNRNHLFKDKYYKLKRNKISKTITSHIRYDCHMYIHPTQARGLSPREATRFQTFPDDYLFRDSLNDWYKQIGNADPALLSESIASDLIKYYK